MHSGGGQKVVATLRRDGNVVYPKEEASSSPIRQVANLLNYKIKTESELLYKSQNNNNSSSNSIAGPTVVDMGKQLLQYARDGDVLGVQQMMARGAPFAADWLGMSAMHFAAMNNDLEICEILLHGGVNKDARTKVDRTPLHLACFYGHERIVQLLLSKKCTVNAIDMLRMTPLHWAVEKQHKTIVRLLLKHNADVTAVSKFGKTPLALAVLTEQADLLTELEAARQLQAKSKLTEETEDTLMRKKETSEAINSIIDEPETTRRIDERENDLVEGESIDFAVKMTALDGIKEEPYNASTLNMLKDHGIAMMTEDDDTSKEMLNKALKNGRQLVLSEGGIMLLHETQRNMKQGTNTNNNNNYNNNDNDHIEMDGVSAVGSTASTKVRMNVIKQRDNSAAQIGAVSKNKNIRIISLNDFKKLCADKKPNAIQKIPSSLASSGVVRQLPDGTKLVNMRQLQSRKLRLPSINDVAFEKSYKDDEMIIEEHSESSDEIKRINATNTASTTTTAAATTPSTAAATAAAISTPRPYYTKQMCPVQTLQLRPLASNKVNNSIGTIGSIQQQHQQQRVQTRSNSHGDSSTLSTTTSTTTKTPNVMPLLTTSEICRQLLELRRQNEDLRRKFEVAQIEKEELRQRLEQLEELVLAKQDEFTTTQNES